MRVSILIVLFALSALSAHAAPGAPADWASKIQKTGERQYTIDPAIFDDISWMARQGRVVPRYEDGRPVGFRLLGVRPDGFWARIGLANGDTIRAANGRPISSPSTALEIYQEALGRGVVLDVERAGRIVRLTYSIPGKPPPAAPASLVTTAPSKASVKAKAVKRGAAALGLQGRFRGSFDLDFGKTPRDVRGHVTLKGTDVQAQPPAQARGVEMPVFVFGAVDMRIAVEPGPKAAVARVEVLTVDGEDLQVKTDPTSTIHFAPGRGLDGRLDLRLDVTAGQGIGSRLIEYMGRGRSFRIACSGRLAQPRCRLDRSASDKSASPKSP